MFNNTNNDNYNCNLYDEYLGESFPNLFSQYENLNKNENLNESNYKNISYENNNDNNEEKKCLKKNKNRRSNGWEYRKKPKKRKRN